MPSNRVPVLAGAVVTALVLEVFAQFPMDGLLGQLRVLAGIPGAALAGYLARSKYVHSRLSASMKTGIYAVLLGLTLHLSVILLYNTAVSVVAGAGIPDLGTIGFFVFITLFPFVPLYILEGAVFGTVGKWLHGEPDA